MSKPRANGVSVRLARNQAVVADRCLVAESFFDRLRGLIGRQSFPEGEGMLFPRCNDIHMWFMSIPIDVVFLSRQRGKDGAYVVASTRSQLRPWRPLPVRDGQATEALELPAGTIERFAITKGDELCIS